MVYYAGLVLKASFPRSGKIEEKTGFMAKKTAVFKGCLTYRAQKFRPR
jgi:hypothetical protein